MSFVLKQENCHLKVFSILGDDVLVVDEFYADETLNAPFEFTCLVHAMDSNLDMTSLLGTSISIEITTHKAPRYFSGIIGKAEHIRTIIQSTSPKKEIAFYQIKIYPKFWLLNFSKDYKIYQNKTPIDIISEIFREKKITDFRIDAQSCGKKLREYCVQYGESYFDFASRLMEEEGIFYYFTHEKNIHTMVLCDANAQAKALEPEEIPYTLKASQISPYNVLNELRVHASVSPKGAKIVDFDYEKPSTSLSNTADDAVGQGDIIYDYPGFFKDVSDGDTIARQLKNAHIWQKSGVSGKSTVLDFSPCINFKIKDHPRKDINKKHIVYKVKHRIFNQKLTVTNRSSDNGEFNTVYENDFFAFSHDLEFKPEKVHEKQKIICAQTAIVTGPPGEEIYTDKFGRIKVKFHWDTSDIKDDKSSCWIRVSQNWSGTQWGGLVIPRIGMEVVVSYLDGDPDRPLVIGCVYNGDKLPPYAASNPTRSTFKTESSKGGGGFNELRFEDKKDAEEIYFHAQKDFNTEIIESRTETIDKKNDTLTLKMGSKFVNLNGEGTKYHDTITDGDRILDITKGNQNINIKQGDQKIHITQGNQDIQIDSGDQKITIKKGNSATKITSGDATITLSSGNMTIKITGNTTIKSTGMMSFESMGPMMLKSQAGITMQSAAAINMTAGAAASLTAGAIINMTANAAFNVTANAGVNIQSNGVARLASQGMTTVEGAMIMVTGKAMATLQGAAMANVVGALVKIN
jgi:type VI secretion system secreted protein VgrG